MLGTLVGCSTPERPSPAVTPYRIDKLNLLAAPVALNLDGVPGPDSVAVKIYASSAHEAKPVAITSGTLELMAFEGLLKKSTNTPQALKTWTFTAAELRPREFKASIIRGYEITASFSGLKPKADKLTVVARYRPDNGPPIYSAASTISLTAN